MDEFERELLRKERNRQSDKNEKKDYFSSLTILQIVFSFVIIMLVVFIAKSNSKTSQNLKNDFTRLMNYSIVEKNGADAVKTLKEFLSEPFELMPAFSPVTPIEDTTESDGEQIESETQAETEEIEETEESEPITQAETKESENFETTSDMGGEDIELYKAADGTSFSPVATTSGIVKPVESTKYTSYFGYRINPITNSKSFHTGLDIAAPLGTKIRAAYNGTVRKTGEDSHSGKYVILRHDDGFETFYCHCSKILAEEGAVIRKGETIALVGSTGWSTGPHLHFEVRKNGERLNPLGILENDN